MRMIDADELTLWLKKAGRVLKWCEDTKEGRKLVGKIIDYVEDMPTAYDVKSVVEQLEEKADEANDKWMAYGQEDDYFDGKEDGMREAIEIVKSGGAV